MIGLAGAAVSNIIIYFNQSYFVMMAAWTFNAIIQFGVWPGVFKIVSTKIAPRMRSTAVFLVVVFYKCWFGTKYAYSLICESLETKFSCFSDKSFSNDDILCCFGTLFG